MHLSLRSLILIATLGVHSTLAIGELVGELEHKPLSPSKRSPVAPVADFGRELTMKGRTDKRDAMMPVQELGRDPGEPAYRHKGRLRRKRHALQMGDPDRQFMPGN